MRLSDYKLIFITLGLIGILLIASPVLSLVLHIPMGQPFTEVFLLGSGQKLSDYPYNITVGQIYPIYVGVGNHEDSSSYYLVNVKFSNQSKPLLNVTEALGWSKTLYEYHFLLQSSKSIQTPFTFSISNVTFIGNQSSVNELRINGNVMDVNVPSFLTNTTIGFQYWLVFELLKYNKESASFKFDNQFVSLQLKLSPP